MNRRPPQIAFLLILTLTLGLFGCSGTELKHTAIPLALALDLSEQGIAATIITGELQKDSPGKVESASGTGGTIPLAIDSLEISLQRAIVWEEMRALIVTRPLLEAAGLNTIMAQLPTEDFPASACIAAAEGDSVIAGQGGLAPWLDPFPQFIRPGLRFLLADYERSVGSGAAGRSVLLPFLTRPEDSVLVEGAIALSTDWRPVMALNEPDLEAWMLATGKTRYRDILLPSGEAARLEDIRVNLASNPAQIDLSVTARVKGDAAAARSQLEAELMQAITRFQSEGIDLLGLGRKLYVTNPRGWPGDAAWQRQFQELPAHVSVTLEPVSAHK
jgi:hypothetical protein